MLAGIWLYAMMRRIRTSRPLEYACGPNIDFMETEAAKKQFNRRSAIAETPFGYLKGVFGLRQFRHRGLEKVDHEWRWSCLSPNVKKLLRTLARWRKLGAEMANWGPAEQDFQAAAA